MITATFAKTCAALAGILAAGPGRGPGPGAPPRLVPHHWCASACDCGCAASKTCGCDGRTCPIQALVPGGGVVRYQVEPTKLPKRKTSCPNRPLYQGRTLRRDDSGMFWICNDPECHDGDCDSPDNADFRAGPEEALVRSLIEGR